jgi:hypothetical protein
MFKLEIRGILLYRKGHRNTLRLAELHNSRSIPTELDAFGHIDPRKSILNHEIVSLQGKPLEETVVHMIEAAGMDTNKGTLKRADKGYAIEWLFSVTHGFECDFIKLYAKCLEWLKTQHPACPIAYAIIHFDEAWPHMHVVMVPIEGSHLPASDILGYKGISRQRTQDLYEQVGKYFGLSYGMNLKGAAKKNASDSVIKELQKRGYEERVGLLWEPICSAVHARPEPFFEASGIRIEQLLSREY